MSNFQFGVYEKIRKAEEDSEKNKRKNGARNKGKSNEDVLTIPSLNNCRTGTNISK